MLGSSEVQYEWQQEARKKIQALQMRCNRASEIMAKKSETIKNEAQTLSLMKKGIYTEETRELCRILVAAGCSRDHVGDVIEAVFTTVGITLDGHKVSGRTVAEAFLKEESWLIFKLVMKYQKLMVLL
jgi:hypothetical protein